MIACQIVLPHEQIIAAVANHMTHGCPASCVAFLVENTNHRQLSENITRRNYNALSHNKPPGERRVHYTP
jgi:hypothetical protein